MSVASLEARRRFSACRRTASVITGTDHVTANGTVCNKIGTCRKALAAHDNGVPFQIVLPSPTIVFSVNDGRKIPTEHCSACEVATMTGRIETAKNIPDGLPVANYAFDVTPARLVKGLITERGVLRANREVLAQAFSERAEKVG